MASSYDKITGSDIFGGDLKGAYSDFVRYNKEAAESVELLKKEVKQLNDVLKQKAGVAVQMGKVNTATKK